MRAFQSVYGYEFQGDNLLIARANLLLTFVDHYRNRFGTDPDKKHLKQIANVIVWNLWQMDGLTETIPFRKPPEQKVEFDMLDMLTMLDEPNSQDVPAFVRLYDWRAKTSLSYSQLLKGSKTMKFDYIIGNPPYQDESNGNKTFAPQYHLFMDSVYAIAEKVELITPARFLFNAGSTPKSWNQKMLNDEHFKVESYEPDASKVFPDTDIKGGVAITYRDDTKNFGAIGIFTTYEKLNSLLRKIHKTENKLNLSKIVTNRGIYRFSDKMYKENPHEMERITDSRILSNAFDRFPGFFFPEKPNDNHSYVRIFGKSSGKRVYR